MPPKYNWLKWYPVDWIADTRVLSLDARGAWVDILCFAFFSKNKGVYERSISEAKRELGIPEKDWERVVSEIAKVATVRFSKDSISVTSRRMVHEEKMRKMNSKYQAKHRSKVNKMSASGKSKAEKLEARSKKLEARDTTTPPNYVPPQGWIQGQEVMEDLKAKLTKPYKAPLQPHQRLVVGFKMLMGVDLEDREWDKIYFPRFSRSAKDMVNLFRGDWEAAYGCSRDLVKGFEAKGLSWTPETLMKHAGQWIVKNGGIDRVTTQRDGPGPSATPVQEPKVGG